MKKLLLSEFKACFYILSSIFVCACLLLGLTACKSSPELSNFVSEFRSNIYTAQNQTVSLTAYLCEKENPYAADGIKANMTNYLHVRLFCEDNTRDYSVFTDVIKNGKTEREGGECNFDNLQKCFSLTLNASTQAKEQIVFYVSDGENQFTLTARSVIQGEILDLKHITDCVYGIEKDYIDRLTSGVNFLGEFHIRLLCEQDDLFYYVGIIGKDKTHLALLIDAVDGQLISKKVIAYIISNASQGRLCFLLIQVNAIAVRLKSQPKWNFERKGIRP